MKLTEKDKSILKEWHNTDQDIQQIEAAIPYTTFSLYQYKEDGTWTAEKRIPLKKALALCGRRVFLSGMHRSAFHFSAERDIELNGEKGWCVGFDSKAYFKE